MRAQRVRPTPVIAKYGKFEYVLAEHYRFEDELGRGAMGTVYRAQDVKLGRPVAIKMLHPMLTNELGVARFQSEIRIAAGLHHPNIIGVHDSGEADGRLFFVMDYLGGETLRDRLKREKQLSVEDALRITEQVADGLQYAHEHGVVHRDVKPENIILAEGRACVVDFGLARALGDVDTDRLTASGLSVGTPHYLSPEQAAAEKDVGPRADQYSLACVLYEMLVGEPPFTGPTATSIAMRHISEEARPLRLRRHTTPIAVEVAVMRAMEKVPADRFASVREFATTLRARASGFKEVKHAKPKRRMAYAGLVIVIVLALGLPLVTAITRSDAKGFASLDDALRSLTGRSLDTNKYVVFPFVKNGNAAQGTDLDQQLRDALSSWSDIAVPSAFEVRDALGGRNARVTAATRADAARSLRAGRYIVGQVFSENGLIQVRAELHDATEREPTRNKSVALSPGASPDSLLDHLVYGLLFAGEEAGRSETAMRGTRNRRALTLYLRAKLATRTWNLPLADSTFADALRSDPAFPQALLGLVQTRIWMHDDAPELSGLLARAREGAARLSSLALMHVAAIQDFRARRFHEACGQYEMLTKQDSLDFAAWLGLAECNRRDNVVVTDGISSSGMRFRASRYHAIVAFNRAFDLLPSVDPCCISRAAEMLQRLLITSNTRIRRGVGIAPDTERYGAYPQWLADTLAFVPVPERFLTRTPPITHTLAVERMRGVFFDFAARQVALFSQSATALEVLGEALDLRGYATAVDTIRRARSLSKESGEALRLGVTEVWLRLKFALPNGESELEHIRTFAESLLAHSEVKRPADADQLASLAVLLGDGDRAATLSELGESIQDLPFPVPREVVTTAQKFLTYAALGGPADSLRDIETRLASGIANGVVLQNQPEVRNLLLSRAIGLAYPNYRSSQFGVLDTVSDGLLAAEAAHRRGDIVGARAALAKIAQERVRMRAADVTLDAVFPEAWLQADIGNASGAQRDVSKALQAVRAIPARRLADATIAGSLIQAMELVAHLSAVVGDRAAAKTWARAVSVVSTDSFSVGRQRREKMAAIAR